MASCCCSPPESCPAGWPRRSPENRKRRVEALDVGADRGRIAPDGRAEREVFRDREAGEDVPPFRDEGDARGDHVLERDAGERFAGEGDRAGGRPDDAGDRREQRGLAGAVRPDDADDLAARDREVDAAHGRDRP